jgi:hypothetical protein
LGDKSDQSGLLNIDQIWPKQCPLNWEPNLIKLECGHATESNQGQKPSNRETNLVKLVYPT